MSPSTVTPLIDSYGRQVRKLRLSLTDRCNLRCSYCMPVDAKFMNEKNYLSFSEIHEIISELCGYGLKEVRITGGEPLLRRSFTELTTQLARLPLEKIGMTTNGIFLERYLPELKRDRVHNLNISLDSLNSETFSKITYGGKLESVLRSIFLAKELGFHVKLNVVAMKGINDDEIFDFVEFSRANDIEVRFLELMRIGVACSDQNEKFISAAQMMNILKTGHTLTAKPSAGDSTSFNFILNTGAKIGFIASESQAFCGQCSRWRLSADGVMRACLLKEDGLSIKGKSAVERKMLYQKLLGMKPAVRPAEVSHIMNSIGG